MKFFVLEHKYSGLRIVCQFTVKLFRLLSFGDIVYYPVISPDVPVLVNCRHRNETGYFLPIPLYKPHLIVLDRTMLFHFILKSQTISGIDVELLRFHRHHLFSRVTEYFDHGLIKIDKRTVLFRNNERIA